MFHCLAMGQISWCHYRCPKFCLLRKFPLSIILHDTRGWERTFLLYYSKSLFPVDNYGVLGVFFGFEQSQTHFASLGLLHHTNIFKNVIFCQKKKKLFSDVSFELDFPQEKSCQVKVFESELL